MRLLLTLGLIACAAACSRGEREPAAPARASDAAGDGPPNVVLILADDLGFGDLGCYGQKRILTPNLDRMAAEGVRFTQFYAGGSVCVPSRCALMTGKHTGHAAVRVNATVALPEEETTLPELLRQAGYRNACIGKWAFGRSVHNGSPLEQGFDTYYGFIDQIQAHRYYPPFLLQDDRRVTFEDNPSARTHYSQDLFTEQALRFLESSADEGGPFFLYLAYCLPHADLDAPEDSLAPYRAQGWPERPYREDGSERLYGDQPTPRAAYAAMVSRLDREVGRVLDALRELGLEEDTLVLFASDNGPSEEGGGDPDFFDSNGPFRGGKSELYEGGLRVPLLARWPGRIAPGVSDLVCAAWDVLPTCAELAGLDVPQGLDGLSLVPTLLGRAEEQRAHDFLYWEHALSQNSRQALRRGDWKAVRRGVHGRKPHIELYDLRSDPAEARDLAASEPKLVAELGALMDEAHEPSAHNPLTYGELYRRPEPRPAGKER